VSDLKTMGKREEATGSVEFKKPNKMRWDYDTPEKKLLVTDGATVWFYMPADKQVVTQRFSDAYRARTPIALLAGKTKLTKEFRVQIVSRDAASGETTFVMSPREAGGMGDVRLTVHEPTLEIRGMAFVDPYGNRIAVRFSDAKVNTKIADARFHFAAPAGTETIPAP
jgi:outer membrane lipoprotein carrier protein